MAEPINAVTAIRDMLDDVLGDGENVTKIRDAIQGLINTKPLACYLKIIAPLLPKHVDLGVTTIDPSEVAEEIRQMHAATCPREGQ